MCVLLLSRFSFHRVSGSILYKDNKAITFLQVCHNLKPSGEVDDGTTEILYRNSPYKDNNHLADVLSRSPRKMTDEETRQLTRPDQIMVHRIHTRTKH
jgi:hypothetical protein